jgi:hypothetical protein
MLRFPYRLGVTLLIVPPDTARTPMSPGMHYTVRSALHELATQWEILDPRESLYVLTQR